MFALNYTNQVKFRQYLSIEEIFETVKIRFTFIIEEIRNLFTHNIHWPLNKQKKIDFSLFWKIHD